MVKIVHVTPSLSKGGGERVVVDLANEQVDRGYDVTVIIGNMTSKDTCSVFNDDVKIKIVSHKKPKKLLKYPGMIIWQIRQRAWLKSCDVIHCHLTFGAVFGTLCKFTLFPRAMGPAILETYHAVGMKISPAMRALHAIMASTRDALVLMARDGYWNNFISAHPDMPIRIIENGVSSHEGRVGTCADRQAFKARIGIPADCRYIVGTVGQFRADRQPWLHIDLFARIARVLGPDVHFVIAGDGPARARVETEIERHGLQGRVRLLGVTDSAAEPASIMDLYITLAVGPVVGIAALEAVFATVPTIAIQLNDTYESSAEDFVWSSHDLQSVADKAIFLLRDKKKLEDLGTKQQIYATKRYGMTHIADEYDHLYNSVIQQRR